MRETEKKRMFESERERVRGKGEQPELIIRRAKEDLSERTLFHVRAILLRPLFFLFIPAALPGSSVDRVGVVLTTQYYHHTKLARNHGREQPRARIVDAQRVKQDKRPNGSRSPRRSDTQKYDKKKNLGG